MIYNMIFREVKLLMAFIFLEVLDESENVYTLLFTSLEIH